MNRVRPLVPGIVVVLMLAAGTPAARAQALDGSLCKHDKARIDIPSDFVLSACFDGEQLFIKNTSSIVLDLRTEGAGPIERVVTFPPLQSLLVANDRPASVLPPAMEVRMPIGAGKASVQVKGTDPKLQRYYLIAASVIGLIPGASFLNGLLEFVSELDTAIDRAKRCLDANNMVGDVGCTVRADWDVKVAMVSLALKLPGLDIVKVAPLLVKSLLDLFLGTAKYAFDLVDDAEQLLKGTRSLAIAEKPGTGEPPAGALRAPSAFQAFGISPSVIRLQWNDNSPDETGFEISTGSTVRRAAASPQASTGFDWGGLAPETRLCFRVRAVRGGDASEWFPPAAPSNVCAATSASDTPIIDVTTTSSSTTTTSSTTTSTTTTTRLNNWTTTVDSTKGWNYTPVLVREGGPFLVSTLGGTWSVDSVNVPYVGPAGYSPSADANIFQGCKFDSSQPYGKLLAAVSGIVVPVGAGGEFRAPATGSVALRINDIDRCLVDNDGSVRVQIVAPG